MFNKVRHTLVQLRKTNLDTSQIGRIAVALVLAFGILAMQSILYPRATLAMPNNYTCPANNICHGEVIWPGHAYGTQTEDEVVTLGCIPSACKPISSTNLPHIGNVLFLADLNGNGSNCQPVHECWVEAGYHTVTNSGGTSTSSQYYWADFRPGFDNFNIHPLGAVQSGDLGHNVFLFISLVKPGDNSDWNVEVIPQTNSWSGKSGGNTMFPDNIQMGMELLGTNGASANTGYFTFNYWATGDGNFHPQTNSGSLINNSPVESNWFQTPASNGSNNGGSFYTGCPC